MVQFKNFIANLNIYSSSGYEIALPILQFIHISVLIVRVKEAFWGLMGRLGMCDLAVSISSEFVSRLAILRRGVESSINSEYYFLARENNPIFP